jgi:hypothetical protein
MIFTPATPPCPTTLVQLLSRAYAATPRGTFQARARIPGTSATRSGICSPIQFPPHAVLTTLQFAIHEFIRTLADRLGQHGAATRAQAIFDSAMQRTSLRWGQAAKLAAGAALVFATREQGRGDRTHYVAVSPSFSSPPSFDITGLAGLHIPSYLARVSMLYHCSGAPHFLGGGCPLPSELLVMGIKSPIGARISYNFYPRVLQGLQGFQSILMPSAVLFWAKSGSLASSCILCSLLPLC